MRAILAFILAITTLVGCDRQPEPEYGPQQLTEAERERIKKLKVRVGGDANYPPFVFRDETGKLTGLSVEMFEELAKRIGLKYEYTFIGQRAEMLKKLEDKEIDMTLASRTSSSRPYLIVTQPYEYSKGTLLINKGFNAAKIETVGAGRGYASVTWLKTNRPEYAILEFEDDTHCIANLRQAKVDACIMGREMAFFFLDALKLNLDDFVLTPVEYSYFLSFGVHADNIELVDILMKGLETIPTAKRDEIIKKWFKEPLN